MDLYLGTEVIIAPFTATKEMENPEDTAEKVGISALIVQVNWILRVGSTIQLFSYYLFQFMICLNNECVSGLQRSPTVRLYV